MWRWVADYLDSGREEEDKKFLDALSGASFTVDKKTSANFGEIYEATIDNTRVYFQREQIVIGDFVDEENTDVQEALNLGRMPPDGSSDYNILPEEDLRPYVQAADVDENADHFCKTFFANTAYEELGTSDDDELSSDKKNLFHFLQSPKVYARLPRLSSAVSGVTFLEDAAGLVLAYDYHALASNPKALEQDLALGCEVYRDAKAWISNKE